MSNVVLFDGPRKKPAPPPFVPTDLAGLWSWHRSDLGTWQDIAETTQAVAEMDPIGRWKDQSGLNHHVDQATAGQRPVLKLGIVNGYSVVSFDGVDDFLASANYGLVAPQTVFVALHDLADTPFYHRIFDGLDTNSMGVYMDPSPVPTGAYTMVGSGAGGCVTTPARDDFHIYAFLFAGAGENSVAARDDGAYTAPANLGNTNAGGLAIATAGVPALVPGQIHLAEIIVYNVALSVADRALVRAYLNARYSIY